MEDANNDGTQSVENENTETVETKELTPEEIAAIVKENESLRTHNSTLLGEKKQSDAAKRLAEDAKLAADTAAALAANDAAALEKSLKEKYEPQLEAYRLKDEKRFVTDVVQDSLLKGGVDPATLHAAMAYLDTKMSGNTQIADDVATIGGKTVEAYVSDYLANEGKVFVRAPANSGASAPGSSSSTVVGNYTAETYTLTEHSRIALKDKVKANAIAKALGKSFRSE